MSQDSPGNRPEGGRWPHEWMDRYIDRYICFKEFNP